MEVELKIPEIEISVKYKKYKKSELYTVKTSEDCANVFRKIFDADTMDWTEEFIILCLSRSNKVLGYRKISQGGTTGTIADPKVIFTVALNMGASQIIIAHNHPSGDLRPSRADEAQTLRIKQGGALLDIKVLDHIIITDEGYFSFADEGLM